MNDNRKVDFKNFNRFVKELIPQNWVLDMVVTLIKIENKVSCHKKAIKITKKILFCVKYHAIGKWEYII